MTGPRSNRGRVRRTKRKRRAARRSGDDAADSDDSLDKDEFLTENWNYDIKSELTKKEFENPDMCDTVSAKDFNIDLVRKTGLAKPLVITDPPSEFNFRMPEAESFSAEDVRKLVGGSRLIEVVEVSKQSSRQMSLDNFINYYKTPEEKRTELLNLLSLEFSQSRLEDFVSAPGLTRELDWVDLFWPEELRTSTSAETYAHYEPSTYPKVKHYCLMSVKDCFTDFHIDFGGTSVWYHVLKGKKVFWMVEPTEQNMTLYEEWILNSSADNSAFFGDIVEKCARVELVAGNTFIIPSGWIHGVYTLDDSLVFGGNFLHSFSIPIQLRVLRCEDRIKVTKKYRYPFHNEMLWYVIDGIVKCATGLSLILPPDFKDAKEEKAEQVSEEQGLKKADPKNEELEDVKEKKHEIENDDQEASTSDTKNNELPASNQMDETSGTAELKFNEEFLDTLTEMERDGYFTLLEHMRKKLTTRHRSEAMKRVIDPDRLLDLFDAVLKHKVEKDNAATIGRIEDGKDTSLNTEGSMGLRASNSAIEEGLELTSQAANDTGTSTSAAPKKLEVIGGVSEKPDSRIDDSSEDIDVDVVDPDDSTISPAAEVSPSNKRSTKAKKPKAKSNAKSRGTKRKLVTKEKVSKTPKPKNRKTDGPGVHPEKPLIVGGLPPAIMPADAPQAPNPYHYDPLASVTALGHKQLPSAYRRTANMAKAPPTQKFRLLPVQRTMSTSEEAMPSASVVLTAEKPQQSSDVSSKDTHVMPESASVEHADQLGRIVSPVGKTSRVHEEVAHVRNKEPGLSYATRSATTREKKVSQDHAKMPIKEFEYRSPLAQTYAHSSASTSTDFSRIKTLVGYGRNSREEHDGGDNRDSRRFEHKTYSRSEDRRFDRSRSKRDSPICKPSAEEMFDHHIGRDSESGNRRSGYREETPQNRSRYRRSFDDAHERFRGSPRSEPRRDLTFSRSEREPVIDRRRLSYEERPTGQQYPIVSQPAKEWRVPPGFNPSIPPPAIPGNLFQPGQEFRSVPPPNSENWRILAPPPPLPQLEVDAQNQADSLKNPLDRAGQMPLPVTATVNGEDSRSYLFSTAQGPSESIASDASASAAKGDSQTNDGEDNQETYRPTPICDLPPRPDSILQIPPIVFEHNLTVTGILKRPHLVKNSSQNAMMSPQSSSENSRDGPPQRAISGFGGTTVVANDVKEKTGPEVILEEQIRNLVTADSKPLLQKEPLDYMSTANELARLMSEITEEAPQPPGEPRIKKSESQTVLSDPRRAKNVAQEDVRAADGTAAKPKKSSKKSVDPEPPDTLIEDLSSLVAEYDEIDE